MTALTNLYAATSRVYSGVDRKSVLRRQIGAGAISFESWRLKLFAFFGPSSRRISAPGFPVRNVSLPQSSEDGPGSCLDTRPPEGRHAFEKIQSPGEGRTSEERGASQEIQSPERDKHLKTQGVQKKGNRLPRPLARLLHVEAAILLNQHTQSGEAFHHRRRLQHLMLSHTLLWTKRHIRLA
ncbi:hypothetical protein FVEG_07270 [Fusarium verticillioides 7600]|uniref:Uncharacterized protein n=1 Tax=Gibberella moniliformis (strain M3125 / FGSC 7600) TaxID=334819 RepID=W7M7P2_GIBM7|nr:hypothetical protein FVEG_07270 [Fusarium verticillioides 7600]EWG47021.1 hypothetical protein FVEG_07270 [Fusarium verticillioides 7600]